jgi:WD40 repeat protein
VAVAPDGEIVTAGADGKVYVLSPRASCTARSRRRNADHRAGVSRRRQLIAAAGIRGSVAIIDRAARKLERTLVGPGLPVWSAAFFPDGRTLLTGGSRPHDPPLGRGDRRADRQRGHGRARGSARRLRGDPAPRCSAPASPATR